MNKSKRKTTFIVMLIMTLIFATSLFAEAREDSQNSLYRPEDGSPRSMINVGNWTYWIWENGMSGNKGGSLSGGFYPTLSAAAVYQDGFVWGGYVGDQGNPSDNLRLGGSMYYIGTQEGWIQDNGEPIGTDNARVGVYMIRSDWASLTWADVIADAAEWHENLPTASVNEALALEYLVVCATGWAEWPTDLGAPYYDEDGNGEYNPVLEYNEDYEMDVPVSGIDTDEDGIIDLWYDRPGIANADQVVFLITNDVSDRTTQFFGTEYTGMELQITLWAYNQPTSALGNCVFKKFKLINKSDLVGGNFTYEDMYVGQFVDPDVGASANDYVGCDSVLSIGFAYNATLTDVDYDAFQKPPPAVGYDFFQGPIIYTGNEEDVAVFDLQRVTGAINLPMTSFGYFSAGSLYGDPSDGDSDFEEGKRMYNLMRGYAPTADLDAPESYTHNSGDLAGRDTKYPLNGDPFAGTGDLDGRGSLASGDRRMYVGSGPFTMAPGDTQEVVLGIVGGIIEVAGGNNTNAVAQMKIYDRTAQYLFDNLFQGIPKPPVAPKVIFTEYENEISLNWGYDIGAVAITEAQDPVLGFNFEGYNVYQLPNASASISTARKIATFDVINTILFIRGEQFSVTFGDVLTVPIQKGTDNGIQRSFMIERDYINEVPLYPGNTYYFAVTAYNYVDDPTVPTPTLESELRVITVIPQKLKPGQSYPAEYGDNVDVAYDGPNDGQVVVQVVSPNELTGDNYQVYFNEDTDTNSATYGEIVWNLDNLSASTTLLENQRIRGDVSESDQDIVDGMLVKVAGPAPGFHGVFIVQAGDELRPETNDDVRASVFMEDVWAYGWVLDDFWPLIIMPDGGRYWVTMYPGYNVAADNAGFVEYCFRNDNWSRAVAQDYETRFVEGGAWAIDWSGYIREFPFEFWNIGSGTPDDPADDFQMIPVFIDDDGSGTYNWHGDAEDSGGSDDAYTDRVYCYNPADGSSYADFAAACAAGDEGGADDAIGAEIFARTVFMNHNGVGGYTDALALTELSDPDPANWTPADTVIFYENGWLVDEENSNGGVTVDGDSAVCYKIPFQPVGTIYRWNTNKPIVEEDVFAFTAPNYVDFDAEQAKEDVKLINVFPNPYYGFNPQSTNRFDQYVTFTHLPQRATIRIFNLAGENVRTIEKDTDRQFQQWNLQNDSSLPVASGLYIAYIDMPDLGKEKVLKLYVIQKEQIIQYF